MTPGVSLTHAHTCIQPHHRHRCSFIDPCHRPHRRRRGRRRHLPPGSGVHRNSQGPSHYTERRVFDNGDVTNLYSLKYFLGIWLMSKLELNARKETRHATASQRHPSTLPSPPWPHRTNVAAKHPQRIPEKSPENCRKSPEHRPNQPQQRSRNRSLPLVPPSDMSDPTQSQRAGPRQGALSVCQREVRVQ